MKKIIICIIFACLGLSASAQIEDGNYEGFQLNNEDNIVDIYVTSFGDGVTQFSEGKKKKAINGKYHIIINTREYVVANFSKGIANGEWTQYLDNKIYEKGTMKNGQYDGKLEAYNHFSFERADCIMKDGILQHLTAYFSNGQKETEHTYDENGRIHGNTKTYDRNGKLVGDENYNHGQRDGSQMKIDSYGKVISNYKNGVQVGSYSNFYSNGNIHSKGSYDDNGKKTGNWIFGEENGIITENLNYIDDEEQGEQKTFYTKSGAIHTIENIDGNIKTIKAYEENPNRLVLEESYKDGRRDGVCRTYHKGILWFEEVYKDGKQLSRTEYKNGKPAILYLLDETNNLSEYKRYDEEGKTIYKNKAIKKNKVLLEDESGIIDIK